MRPLYFCLQKEEQSINFSTKSKHCVSIFVVANRWLEIRRNLYLIKKWCLYNALFCFSQYPLFIKGRDNWLVSIEDMSVKISVSNAINSLYSFSTVGQNPLWSFSRSYFCRSVRVSFICTRPSADSSDFKTTTKDPRVINACQFLKRAPPVGAAQKAVSLQSASPSSG